MQSDLFAMLQAIKKIRVGVAPANRQPPIANR
jgi:hypothetical protein